jgi:DNA repair protein RecN (Recombination protein N)
MLKTIRILNLAVIQEACVEFGPGLNLLTGETGAGKSILVDSLGLIRGDRADGGLIRKGEDRALVEAVFELPADHPAIIALEERGIPVSSETGESSDLIVRRELRAAGAGRAFINDSPCTVGTLREVTSTLIDLHRQHDQQSLLSREYHLVTLDRFGGYVDLQSETRLAAGKVRQALRRQEELRDMAGRRGRRLEELQAIIDEIEQVAPRAGESEELGRQRAILRNAGALQRLLEELQLSLESTGDGAVRQVSRAESSLQDLAELAPELAPLGAQLEQARIELEDIVASLGNFQARVTADAREDPATALEDLESRLAALESLRIRYGRDEAAVLESCREAAAELSTLADLDQEVVLAEQERQAAVDRYLDSAGRLTQARAKAATRLGPRFRKELAGLAMAQARFEVRFQPSAGDVVSGSDGRSGVLALTGLEKAEFLLGANPGEPSVALARSASGGELSRVMLALHGVLGRADHGSRSLIFDEIDSGIGGEAADRVGSRLKALACGTQVLCVTHLPQVAAYAARHHAVGKRVSRGRTQVTVQTLGAEERVAELARMMSGRVITPVTLKGAAEMIAVAADTHAKAGRESG